MYKNFPLKKTSFRIPPTPKPKTVRYNDSHIAYSPQKKITPETAALLTHGNPYANNVHKNGVTNINNGVFNQKKQSLSTLLTFHYRNPKLVLVLTYLSIFTLGLTIGFIPYLKVFIENCQGNQQQIREIVKYFKFMNTTKSTAPSALALDGIYNVMKEVTPKTAYATGNNDIKLICFGTDQEIKILQMYNSGADADEATIDEFNEFCGKNQQKYIAYTSCTTSIKKVYNIPDKDNSYTQINYKCEKV